MSEKDVQQVRLLLLIEVFGMKYPNNIVEQSHRKVKGEMHKYLGWISREGAESTLVGVELWSMIKQGKWIAVKV